MPAQPATALAQALATSGTTVAFGLPGGGPNLDVVGALLEHDIDFVLAHTETAACIMASTWGAIAGQVTAAVVTRGPGAASAANGVAQATLDRYPLLLVADTVPRSARERVPHQRIDQRSLFTSITKATMVLGADTDIEGVVAAIDLARSAPAGAVHLDYDASAAGSTIEQPLPTPVLASLSSTMSDAEALLATARHPVVILGDAALAAAESIDAALGVYGAPVLSTYQAVGIVDTESPIGAGLFTNGSSERPLLDQADVIITIGLDLVEPIPAPWSYDAPVVAIGSSAITDPYLPVAVEVLAPSTELGSVAAQLLAGDHDWAATAGHDHNTRVRNRLTSGPTTDTFRPVDLVATVAARTPPTATTTVDAGAHFLAIMPLWPAHRPRQLLISNGLATMGFAVPAAIGAAIARPGEPVVALTGDGGLGMCLAELETIARRDLPITVVVFNDAALSLIEIKQTAAHGGARAVRYELTDFAAIAQAMGMAGVVATTATEVSAALRDHDYQSPLLIDARIDPASYPHLMQVTRG